MYNSSILLVRPADSNSPLPNSVLRHLLQEKEFWFIVVVNLIFFIRPLLGETFYFRDLLQHFIPQKMLYLEAVRDGTLPLWDPYRQGGQPALANPNSVVLYPANLIYLVVPLWTAFNLDIIFHFLLCGLATYFFARTLNFSASASFIAALVFEFCGYTLSLGNFMSRLYAAPYLPLLLACFHLFLLQRRLRWFGIASLLGAFQAFSGAPEMVLITFVFIFLWMLVYPYSISRFERLKWFSAFAICAAGIASVQILPTLEMARNSSRGYGMGIEEFLTYSLNPKRLPELFIPGFLGRMDTLSEADYWGKSIVAAPYPRPYLLSIYTGSLTAVLITIGILAKQSVLERAKLLLIFLLTLAVCVSFGRYIPGFDLLYEIPILRWMRYPIKFLGIAVLPAALLAGLGAEALGRREIAGKAFALMMLFAITAGVVATIFSYFPDTARSLQNFFYQKSSLSIHKALQASVWRVTALCLGSALLFYLFMRSARRSFFWLLPVLLFCDLAIAGYRINPTAPKEIFTMMPGSVRLIQDHLGRGKLYREEAGAKYTLKAPSNDIVWDHRYNLEVLNYFIAPFYGIPLIFHRDVDGMSKMEIVQLMSVLQRAPWQKRVRIFSVAGVTTLVLPQKIDVEELQPVALIRNRSNIPLYLYKNKNAIAPANFVSRAVFVTSFRDALSRVLDPDFDPAEMVVLQGSPEPDVVNQCKNAKITHFSSRPNYLLVQLQSECDGYLVLPQPYDTGWRVSIDDSTSKLWKANGAFSAIKVKAGNHRIEMRYLPVSIVIGASISILTMLVLSLILTGIPKRIGKSVRS